LLYLQFIYWLTKYSKNLPQFRQFFVSIFQRKRIIAEINKELKKNTIEKVSGKNRRGSFTEIRENEESDGVNRQQIAVWEDGMTEFNQCLHQPSTGSLLFTIGAASSQGNDFVETRNRHRIIFALSSEGRSAQTLRSHHDMTAGW
jgi:hypothetical protein